MKNGIAAMALSLVFLTGFGVDHAFAQAASARDMEAVRKDMRALQKQLKAVQRVVFKGGRDKSYRVEEAGGGAAFDGDRALLADMQAKIGEIETQMRRLTGSLEEIEYRQREAAENLDRFKRDVEFRLTEIEQGSRPMADLAGGGASPAALVPAREKAAAANRGAPVERALVAVATGTPDEQYAAAFQELRRGNFDAAEAAFTAFLGIHSDHALAGNAQYWLGETYYVRRDYPRAAQAFLEGFQKYPDGAKGADNLLKLGMSLASLNQQPDACAAYVELTRRYPDMSATIAKRLRTEEARADCG